MFCTVEVSNRPYKCPQLFSWQVIWYTVYDRQSDEQIECITNFVWNS